jgi:hypothetical protein
LLGHLIVSKAYEINSRAILYRNRKTVNRIEVSFLQRKAGQIVIPTRMGFRLCRKIENLRESRGYRLAPARRFFNDIMILRHYTWPVPG